MALGKNKRISKGGKRSKKKAVEPMLRKEWYDVLAPANFVKRQFAKTICNKTQGINIAADNLRGRVFETKLSELNDSGKNMDDQYRKIKLIVRDVQDRNLLTQFYGMDLTTDRVRSLVQKWGTLIEATVEAKTADGYVMRLFVIAFTRRQKNQLSKNSYAKTWLIKWVRHRITTIIQQRLAKLTLDQVVTQLTLDIIRDRLEDRCNPIVPLRDLKIRKVKVIRTPKIDLQSLLTSHGQIPASLEGHSVEVEVAATAAPGVEVEAAA